MKRKKWLIAVAAIVIIGLVIASGCVPSYASVLEKNWGISLPWQARLREVYEADLGPSFHGDGVRYHVFSYKYEDYIDLIFAWTSNEHETKYFDTVSQAAEAWLDEINVPAKERPDYDRCFSWNKSKSDNSEIIFFWDTEQNLLYVIENFL